MIGASINAVFHSLGCSLFPFPSVSEPTRAFKTVVMPLMYAADSPFSTRNVTKLFILPFSISLNSTGPRFGTIQFLRHALYAFNVAGFALLRRRTSRSAMNLSDCSATVVIPSKYIVRTSVSSSFFFHLVLIMRNEFSQCRDAVEKHRSPDAADATLWLVSSFDAHEHHRLKDARDLVYLQPGIIIAMTPPTPTTPTTT